MSYFPYKRWPAHLKDEVLKKVSAEDSLKLMRVDRHSRKFILTYGPMKKPLHCIRLRVGFPSIADIDYEFYCDDTETPAYTLSDSLPYDSSKGSNVLQFVQASREVWIDMSDWDQVLEECPRLEAFFPNFRHPETFEGLQLECQLKTASMLRYFPDTRIRCLFVFLPGAEFCKAAKSIVCDGIPSRNPRAEVHLRAIDHDLDFRGLASIFEKTMVAPIDINSEKGQRYKKAYDSAFLKRGNFGDLPPDENLVIYGDFWRSDRVFCHNLDHSSSNARFFSVFNS